MCVYVFVFVCVRACACVNACMHACTGVYMQFDIHMQNEFILYCLVISMYLNNI